MAFYAPGTGKRRMQDGARDAGMNVAFGGGRRSSGAGEFGTMGGSASDPRWRENGGSWGYRTPDASVGQPAQNFAPPQQQGSLNMSAYNPGPSAGFGGGGPVSSWQNYGGYQQPSTGFGGYQQPSTGFGGGYPQQQSPGGGRGSPHRDFERGEGGALTVITEWYNPATGERTAMPDSGYRPRPGSGWQQVRGPEFGGNDRMVQPERLAPAEQPPPPAFRPGQAQPIQPPSPGQPYASPPSLAPREGDTYPTTQLRDGGNQFRQWAMRNPNDPRATPILEYMRRGEAAWRERMAQQGTPVGPDGLTDSQRQRQADFRARMEALRESAAFRPGQAQPVQPPSPGASYGVSPFDGMDRNGNIRLPDGRSVHIESGEGRLELIRRDSEARNRIPSTVRPNQPAVGTPPATDGVSPEQAPAFRPGQAQPIQPQAQGAPYSSPPRVNMSNDPAPGLVPFVLSPGSRSEKLVYVSPESASVLSFQGRGAPQSTVQAEMERRAAIEQQRGPQQYGVAPVPVTASMPPLPGGGNFSTGVTPGMPAFAMQTIGMDGRQTDLQSALAQRDAYIQGLNQEGARFAMARGMGQNIGPPVIDQSAIMRQANDAVKSGYMNPFSQYFQGGTMDSLIARLRQAGYPVGP